MRGYYLALRDLGFGKRAHECARYDHHNKVGGQISAAIVRYCHGISKQVVSIIANRERPAHNMSHLSWSGCNWHWCNRNILRRQQIDSMNCTSNIKDPCTSV